MLFDTAIEATFLRRINRFTAEISLPDRKKVQAHLANTGRMQELLISNRPCLVRSVSKETRKTSWDLLAIKKDGAWVCLVAKWANDFFEDWLKKGLIPGFETFTYYKREKKVGDSRFDFYLEKEDERWLFEIKSVNLVTDGHALFPDAPTERGRRHVQELLALRENGWKTGIFFVTMGQNVDDVSFNEANDPEFAALMQRALKENMMVKAFQAKIIPPLVEFCGERLIK